MDAKITDQKNVLQIRLKKKCSLLHLIASTIDQPLFGTGMGKNNTWIMPAWDCTQNNEETNK